MYLQIEKHVVHILECEAALGSGSESRLSGEELEYAKEFVDNMDTHLNSLVLQHMPANFQKMDRKKAGLCLGLQYCFELITFISNVSNASV